MSSDFRKEEADAFEGKIAFDAKCNASTCLQTESASNRVLCQGLPPSFLYQISSLAGIREPPFIVSLPFITVRPM